MHVNVWMCVWGGGEGDPDLYLSVLACVYICLCSIFSCLNHQANLPIKCYKDLSVNPALKGPAIHRNVTLFVQQFMTCKTISEPSEWFTVAQTLMALIENKDRKRILTNTQVVQPNASTHMHSTHAHIHRYVSITYTHTHTHTHTNIHIHTHTHAYTECMTYPDLCVQMFHQFLWKVTCTQRSRFCQLVKVTQVYNIQICAELCLEASTKSSIYQRENCIKGKQS